jgi:hypothetical protein
LSRIGAIVQRPTSITAVRIAMWSGPRNISTALMRSWSQRGDCHVSDEPLYAHYLAATGLDHPGRDTIIASGDSDWQRVVATLTGPVPGGLPVWYQKHMCHHLLPGMATDWVHGLHNVFLIRDPALVVASYLKSRAQVAPADIGLVQQAELFDRVAQHLGRAPLVIDGEAFLRNPARHLQRLCADAGVPWTDRMLHWPPGPRASDGVWAPHWYAAVWQSTGFARPEHRTPQLDPAGRQVVDACRPAFDALLQHADTT